MESAKRVRPMSQEGGAKSSPSTIWGAALRKCPASEGADLSKDLRIRQGKRENYF